MQNQSTSELICTYNIELKVGFSALGRSSPLLRSGSSGSNEHADRNWPMAASVRINLLLCSKFLPHVTCGWEKVLKFVSFFFHFHLFIHWKCSFVLFSVLFKHKKLIPLWNSFHSLYLVFSIWIMYIDKYITPYNPCCIYCVALEKKKKILPDWGLN